MKANQSGFTLLETIVGIVMLALSFAVLTSLIYPATEQTATIMHQIRAAELGQSMLNEIQNKAFDENSDKSGGRLRCGEAVAPACSTVMANEESGVRDLFDDVDDYNGLTYSSGNIIDSQGNPVSYVGYSLSISVGNDSDYNGISISGGDADDDTQTAKLITVRVTTPTDDVLTFSSYKANF